MKATHDDNVKWFWDDDNSTLPIIGWEEHDDGDTHPNSETTSAFSASGKLIKITVEEAAKYVDMDVSDLTAKTCSNQYKEAWDKTHTPDPINTTMTTLEEEIAQLQAANDKLMSRIASIEESLSTA